MAEQTDRLERVVRLIAYLLNADGPVTRADLEAVFPTIYQGESGRRRFEDDKKALREAAIPLRVDGDTYELRRDEYELPDLHLTDAEQVALSLAARTVDFTEVVWGRLAGTKVGDVDGGSVGPLIQFPGLALLPKLHQAVTSRSRLSLSYHDTERKVDPYGLVLKHGNWYLTAHDHHRDKVVPFRIDRIDESSVEVVTIGAFEVPDDFDAMAAVPDHALAMGDVPPVEAIVRLDRRLAAVLDVGPLDSASGAHDEEDDDQVRVRVPVTFEPAFVNWALGLGELAVVEGPPALRDAVIARLRELTG